MGYFPNGTSGMMYEDKYCSRCIHEDDEGGCAVMLLHMIHNYRECNNDESMLHKLIQLDDDGFNEQCRMFVAKNGD